jgi:hypothetical protein
MLRGAPHVGAPLSIKYLNNLEKQERSERNNPKACFEHEPDLELVDQADVEGSCLRFQ